MFDVHSAIFITFLHAKFCLFLIYLFQSALLIKEKTCLWLTDLYMRTMSTLFAHAKQPIRRVWKLDDMDLHVRCWQFMPILDKPSLNLCCGVRWDTVLNKHSLDICTEDALVLDVRSMFVQCLEPGSRVTAGIQHWPRVQPTSKCCLGMCATTNFQL